MALTHREKDDCVGVAALRARVVSPATALVRRRRDLAVAFQLLNQVDRSFPGLEGSSPAFGAVAVPVLCQGQCCSRFESQIWR